MAPNLIRERHNGREIADQPAAGREDGQVNHAARDGQQEEVHPLEVADDPVETDAEAGFGEFLCRGGPFDLDAEEVAEEGFEEVEGDAAEEEEEEAIALLAMLCVYLWRDERGDSRHPFDGFPER